MCFQNIARFFFNHPPWISRRMTIMKKFSIAMNVEQTEEWRLKLSDKTYTNVLLLDIQHFRDSSY